MNKTCTVWKKKKKRREKLKIIGHDDKIFALVIYTKTVKQNTRQYERTINVKSSIF
jgi:hypothetical protein